MTEQGWTWLILACDLTSLVVVATVISRRIWWGWLCTAVLTAVPFGLYSIFGAEVRPAFTVLACVWAAVHVRNAALWRQDDNSGELSADGPYR